MTTVTTARGPRAGRAPRHGNRGARGSKIRADVRLASGGGYARYFSAWPEIAAWLASARFAEDSPAVTSVRLVTLYRDQGGAQ